MELANAEAINELLDKQALYEVLMRYCRGVDRMDAELLTSVYHPDAFDDHGFYKGGPEGFIEWVLPRMQACESSQHTIGNTLFEIAGDVAYGEAYYHVMHISRKPEGLSLRLSGGRYVDRFERRDGNWRIAHRKCIREWNSEFELENSESIPAHLISGPVNPEIDVFIHPQRDRSDPSYER